MLCALGKQFKIECVDMEEMDKFVQDIEALAYNTKSQIEAFVAYFAKDFLNEVKSEIERRNIVDTGSLLKSFNKNDENNIWEVSAGGLSITVGSILDYAKYVNDGHTTCKEGESKRFVPGYWQGNKFTYDPNAKGGMMLYQQWIEANPYFSKAYELMNSILPEVMDKKFDEWINGIF